MVPIQPSPAGAVPSARPAKPAQSAQPSNHSARGVAAARRCAWGLAAALALAAAAPAQEQLPAPGTEGATAAAELGLGDLVAAGAQALEAEDPVGSWRTFQAVGRMDPDLADGIVGLGRAHLLLGRATVAVSYGERALGLDALRQDAMTLLVRARIRAREFDLAVRGAETFVARVGVADAELLAAQGSALFRVQRTDDAAAVYRQVLERDPLHAEAHLRLGSGLSAPCEVVLGAPVVAAVAALRAGRVDAAIATLRELLAGDAGNPVLHRLLGEALFERRTLASMALHDPAYAHLRSLLPRPDLAGVPLAEFVPGYAQLDGERRAVVERAAGLFGSRLGKLLAVGGRHDLLLEVERTTDAEARAMLRGRRTFDGRVWDDVRGIGGLSAATGIEALDDAAQFGFDTLAHEIAHQVHYFALPRVDRARITALYRAAKENGRCLDFYAATNEAEYFGQGVEAFASLCKRPGGETTHGHTRFELLRVDPDLHDFIAGIVDHDPLRGAGRVPLLRAAIAVALRGGRPEDAATAAALLPVGDGREQALAEAAAAVAAASSI